MILEIADIRIAPGRNADFEAAIERGIASVVTRCKGYRAHQVHKGIESAERYVLLIWWDTLENHTVDFRQGPLFAEWRAIVGPFFASPPHVEHFDRVTGSA
ncbi:MAG TPA: antibiotic biosynthesis monooxygenase [Caldimonas sp.]|jgi:heme-degrading monooxygenase HmoA|nr:antibiotic biosynthesis monooxygenase [Caldimonas sp.]HEX2539503.1 antibiotic biosynthesis monooxygenase [Caldimonas sp.]